MVNGSQLMKLPSVDKNHFTTAYCILTSCLQLNFSTFRGLGVIASPPV